MKDLKGEIFIKATAGDTLILSNIRLQHQTPMQYHSIRLEDIKYIAYYRRTNPRIIFIAALVSLALIACSYFTSDPDNSRMFILYAVITFGVGLALYGILQNKDLRFATSGGAINVVSDNLSQGEMDAFLERTEEAIHDLKTKNAFLI